MALETSASGATGVAEPCICGTAISEASSGASAGDAGAGICGTTVIVMGCGDP